MFLTFILIQMAVEISVCDRARKREIESVKTSNLQWLPYDSSNLMRATQRDNEGLWLAEIFMLNTNADVKLLSLLHTETRLHIIKSASELIMPGHLVTHQVLKQYKSKSNDTFRPPCKYILIGV